MPAAKIMVKNIIVVEAAAKLETVSLSNNMVKNQIKEMPIDIVDQVISSVKDPEYEFAMQLDESTDITMLNYLSILAILLKTMMQKLSC